jgi:ATP phosphoribosyltransferase
MQKYEKEMINLEQELDIENPEELKKEYKRIIRKFNTLAKQYTRIKTMTDNVINDQMILENENNVIVQENERLERENNYLQDFLDKTFEYVSILFNFPKDRLKRLVKNFVDKMKGE